MARIHWIGTGLSSGPGLRRLIRSGRDVTVWNRTVEKAKAVIGDTSADIREFSVDEVDEALKPGDLLVSMLPADWHVRLAKRCLAKGAHFASSSYISPEMRSLDAEARNKGLSFVNEIGLDPGIDHLMAHWLVADYRDSSGFDPENSISFTSYCGGFPKNPNPFRYKFSWSPLGVLKALMSPAKCVSDWKVQEVDRPWLAVSKHEVPLPTPEAFEAYPNRDSIPFMEQYGFDEAWRVKEFVRGTLRLDGWSEAWADVFGRIATLEGPAGQAELARLAEQLWAAHPYGENDPDRVVLSVSLSAESRSVKRYCKTWTLDACGDAKETAMARLVSIPLAIAIEAAISGELPPGVQPIPSAPNIFTQIRNAIRETTQTLDAVESK